MKRCLIALSLLAACGDDAVTAPDAALDARVNAAPTASITSPVAYGEGLGTISVEVAATDDLAVARVELWTIDGTAALATLTAPPYTFSLDTTALTDGVVTLVAKAFDGEGLSVDSAAVPVVVYNNGHRVMNGDPWWVYIPADYTVGMEIDVKDHWTALTENHTIIGVARWVDTDGGAPWLFQTAVGYGECPHSGAALGTGEATSTSPAVAVAAEKNTYPTTVRFIHIAPLDPNTHKGEGLEVDFFVYLVD